MKVLHVHALYRPLGGAEVIMFQAIDVLEERGIRNVVVHGDRDASAYGGRGDSTQAYYVPQLASSSSSRAALKRLEEILKNEQPDVVHVHDLNNADAVDVCARHAPTIQSVLNHGFYCPGGERYLARVGQICTRAFGPSCLPSAYLTHCNSMRPAVLWRSYRETRAMRARDDVMFLACSRFIASCLMQNGCDSDHIRVVWPYVDLPELAVLPTGKDILFAGRVVRAKGLDRLVRALAGVAEPARLIVHGDGPQLPQIRQLVSSLGLEARVEFCGWTGWQDIGDAYRRAAVVVVPSIWPEPFGLVGLEAMSHARPVVAFRAGGIPEWLEDGQTGYLVEPEDVEGLTAAITRVLDNPDAAGRLGMRARNRVVSRFTRRAHGDGLLSAYDAARRELSPARSHPVRGATHENSTAQSYV